MRKKMIYMEISVLRHSKFTLYKISDYLCCYTCDDEIAHFLNIEVDEYRERLIKYDITYCTEISGEIYLKSNIECDRLIEIFENEFVVELTLAKLENRKIKEVRF